MSVARFKDLVIDGGDSSVVGRFWAEALGLTFESRGADAVLRGAAPEQTVWVDSVPESKTVKNRVHLDVHAASVDALIDLGATVLGPDLQPSGGRWTVMADPEGGEFCAFVRAPDRLSEYRLYEMVVDCADPRRTAQWWGRVLGQAVGTAEEENWHWLEGVEGMPFESWVFVPVPEPKTVKNRVHWDVWVDSVDELEEAGATILRVPDDEIEWTVCADPDGNEFCAFVAE